MCMACGCSTSRGDLSYVEQVKANSDHLRGSIREELENGLPDFTEESYQILKFHGIYQQDDRDKRKEAKKLGLDKHYIMMVRTRIPGGVLSADAYLVHDEIAQVYGNGTLRITTRQDFQIHGVLKKNLKDTIRKINTTLLTALGGCGDQERNIITCPEPIKDACRGEVLAVIAELAAHLKPATTAYVEIWLDGIMATPEREQSEPLYGDTYLPRKFKTAIAIQGDNCVDVYSNDLAFIALKDNTGHIYGFDVLVGGSLGRTNRKPDTYAALAKPLGYVPYDRIVDVAKAVVTVQRDYGERKDRKHARLKYLISEKGVEWFKAQVESRMGFKLGPFVDVNWTNADDHLGWHEQGDGLLYLGMFVQNGRIADTENAKYRTGLREVIQRFRPGVRLTPQQNIILCDIEPSVRPQIDKLLLRYGIRPVETIPLPIINSMACPAIPTCGLAVAESERVMPGLMDKVLAELREIGMENEKISIRMTGCPNGCARPYLGDIGLVGTTLGKYDVYAGGDRFGTRLSQLLFENVPLENIPIVIRDIAIMYKEQRYSNESLGDFIFRVGVDSVRREVGAVV